MTFRSKETTTNVIFKSNLIPTPEDDDKDLSIKEEALDDEPYEGIHEDDDDDLVDDNMTTMPVIPSPS